MLRTIHKPMCQRQQMRAKSKVSNIIGIAVKIGPRINRYIGIVKNPIGSESYNASKAHISIKGLAIVFPRPASANLFKKVSPE